MRLAILVVIATSTAAHAANTNGFEKYISDLASSPAAAAKRLADCQMLVTPGGAVREPCKLELADLVGTTPGATLVAKNVKRVQFPKSMLEWIEADVEARANKKLIATFHVIEIGGQGNPDLPNDGWFVAAQAWSRQISDKDATARATLGSIKPPAIADSITPLPKDTGSQDVSDREELVRTMKQVLTQGRLKDALEGFAESDAIIIGSAPGQRYTGKSGAKTIHDWKLALTQNGGVAIGGHSFVGFAATDVVGKLKDKAGTEIPYVAFVVYIQRLTGGGSPAPFPALVMFAVPQ